MKSLLAVILLATSFAKAEKMICALNGAVNEIIQVEAISTGSKTTESIQSIVTYAGAHGEELKSEVFHADGILNRKAAQVEFTSELENGPFGIKKAFIVKDGKKFNLEIRNYCNFYYQEEQCYDGQLLDVVSQPISCSISR
jgi:hypothetical protein